VNSRFANESLSWRRLCRAAVLEQDADRLWKIVQKMNSALGMRQKTLRALANTRRDSISRAPSAFDRAA
jgi:hypothetical protein